MPIQLTLIDSSIAGKSKTHFRSNRPSACIYIHVYKLSMQLQSAIFQYLVHNASVLPPSVYNVSFHVLESRRVFLTVLNQLLSVVSWQCEELMYCVS